LDYCSKSSRADTRVHLLNHDKKRNLIQQRNFNHKLPAAIKSIYKLTDDENDKLPDHNGKKGGKRKLSTEDDKQFGKHTKWNRLHSLNQDQQKEFENS
jgi:hypothetical protein